MGLSVLAGSFLLFAYQLRAAPAIPEYPDPRFREARDLISARVAKDIPSIGISVIHEGKIVWEEVQGLADVGKQIRADMDTAYPVASIAKGITSTGVVLLAEQGLVDLDRGLESYIGDEILTMLPDTKSTATVRDLLTMTAGFPMGFMGVYDGNSMPARETIFKRYGGIQVFPPGEVFHYSNFSTGLAEFVIEKVTGKPFGEAMRELVFNPMAMKSTFYSGDTREGVLVASGHEDNGLAWPAHISIPAGGGGAYSSVSDLRNYALAHLGQSTFGGMEASKPPISRKARQILHDKVASRSNEMFAHGWWRLNLGGGMDMIVSDGHGSGMALVQIIPEQELAVICVMNIRKNEPNGQPLINHLANMVTEAILPGFAERHEEFFQNMAESAPDAASVAHGENALGHWRGHVQTYDGNRVPLSMWFSENGEVRIELEGKDKMLLTDLRTQFGVMEGWFKGKLNTSIGNEGAIDILGRFRAEQDRITGYLNANFYDDRGVYDLPNPVYLLRADSDLTDITR
jgi:CubicO group peptidase (beta-lactamase class C family)